jgi:hypothetical protein
LKGSRTLQWLSTHTCRIRFHVPETIISMNDPENYREFTKWSNLMRIHTLVAFDFESILRPQNGGPLASKHSFYTFSIVACTTWNHEIIYKKTYSGLDCKLEFVKSMQEVYEVHSEHFEKQILKISALTPEEIERCIEVESCQVCNRPFTATNIPHRHHDHKLFRTNNKLPLPGQNGGSIALLCARCNSSFKEYNKVVVISHGSYDLRGLLDVFHQLGSKVTMLCDKSSEKPRTVEIDNKFIFRDFTSFANESLASLATLIPEENLKITKAIFPSECLNDLTRKLPCPYEYVTHESVLVNSQYPPIDNFYDKLHESKVTDEEYERGKRIFNMLKCRHLLDYYENYCLLDVSLLLDIANTMC